jgi:hypothetical protein
MDTIEVMFKMLIFVVTNHYIKAESALESQIYFESVRKIYEFTLKMTIDSLHMTSHRR